MKYVEDTKTGRRNIIGEKVTCKGCGASLPDGERAYYADYEKAVYCRDCLVKNKGSDQNTYFHWGIVKIEGEGA